jgi:poly(A) polymerase
MAASLLQFRHVSVEVPDSPRILPRAEHPVSRKDIAREALKVMYRLSAAGYRAGLVGGSVRDLMLGRRPKDFDIATDARPAEIRRLFRNSRVIGRRFRLVHVLFHERVVEVSTFRSEPEPNGRAGAPGDELLITSDNVFGTPEQDAWRRDFTINALFYDISDFSIVDWVGGVEDLRRRTIRTIGDPLVRFREDPVRMMRACELAGRLGFGIEQRTQAAIEELAGEMAKAAPARLAEELVALLRCGAAGPSMQWMLDLGLLEPLLPEAYAMVQASERGLGEFGQILPVLDRKVGAGRAASDGGLLAAVLLPSVLLRRLDVEAVGQRALRRAELKALVREAAEPFFRRYGMSRERVRLTLEALDGFLRLCEPPASAAERVKVAARASFPDALWLFELLAEATGEGFQELAQWQAAARRRPVLAAGDTAAAEREAARSGELDRRRARRRRSGRRTS